MNNNEAIKRIFKEAMFDIDEAFRIWKAEQGAIDRNISPKLPFRHGVEQ